MKIAIIGATGHAGVYVAQAFANAGHEVVTLVRDQEKAKAKLGPSVSLIQGDLSDRQAIDRVMQGADGLYINLSVDRASKEGDFQPERDAIPALIESATAAGVKRIGFTSSVVQRLQGMKGFDWWVFRLKQATEAKLKSGPIPVSLYALSTFMQNFDEGGNYRQGKGIAVLTGAAQKMFFISLGDFGKMVVRDFETAGHDSREWVIQGPEAFTTEEAANRYTAAYLEASKEAIPLQKAPYGVFVFIGKVVGVFNPMFNYTAKIVTALNTYPEKFEGEAAYAALGRPTETIEDVAKSAATKRTSGTTPSA
jgi:uncharacterized protein YbjT (DUF2867 family)